MSNLDETQKNEIQKNKMKNEMKKYIDNKIIELNKSEKVAILSMIKGVVEDSLICEKKGGTAIRYNNIPYSLLCNIYNLVKKNIDDKTAKLNNV